MVVNGQTFYIYDAECQWDSFSQEMHSYRMGVMDWAANTGSKYVEQRFLIDQGAPNCQILSPSATVDPSGDLQIHAVIEDPGAGIDDEDITIVVTDPEGEIVEVHELEIEDGVITGHVDGPLKRGQYTITITARDRLGNRCNISKTINVESAVLALTGTYAYPNPVDPAESNARIQFSLSKSADVTVQVYDFAGKFVKTLASKQRFGSTESSFIEWGGESADGTDLANGTYIVRVTATDGARTEETNLKVVIWRE
jgi:flagellar hook assembly protein FlgD